MPFPGKGTASKEKAVAMDWHLLTHLSANSAPFFQEEFYTAHFMGTY